MKHPGIHIIYNKVPTMAWISVHCVGVRSGDVSNFNELDARVNGGMIFSGCGGGAMIEEKVLRTKSLQGFSDISRH
jgi:hypothetical protein